MEDKIGGHRDFRKTAKEQLHEKRWGKTLGRRSLGKNLGPESNLKKVDD